MLQVITPSKASFITDHSSMKIEGNAITFDINQEDISIKGTITLGELHPLKKKVMGPFTYLPMECRHEIYSMWHTLKGTLLINGKEVSFNKGRDISKATVEPTSQRNMSGITVSPKI